MGAVTYGSGPGLSARRVQEGQHNVGTSGETNQPGGGLALVVTEVVARQVGTVEYSV